MNINYIKIISIITLTVAGIILYNQTFSTKKSNVLTPHSEQVEEIIFESDDTNEFYEIKEGQVTYESMKKFFNKPEEIVIGTTNSVSGMASWNPESKIANADIRINLVDLKTDNQKRDEHVREFFSDLNAVFQINNQQININYNEKFNRPITGNLTINGITKEISFDVDGIITDLTFDLEGHAQTRMSEFGITPPTMIGIFNADDEIKLGFRISGVKKLN